MTPRRMARVVRNWMLLGGAFVALMFAAGVSPAAAQAGHWVGDWRQRQSSAGQCPSCRIAISGMGRVLTVTASNGWTAQVMADVENGLAAAHGEGRWDEAWPGKLAGRPFAIHLTERGDLLHMTMRVMMREGRLWTIRAAFGRAER